MAKSKLLNVREHLKFLQEVIELRKKYGDCPIVDEAFAQLSVINKAILRKHEAARAAGNRKDIRVEAP